MQCKPIFITGIILLLLINCSPLKNTRYAEAYRYIEKNCTICWDRKSAQEYFNKDVTGIYIYDSVFVNPNAKADTLNVFENILADEINIVNKAKKKDRFLEKLSKENLNPNWDMNGGFETICSKNVVLHDVRDMHAPTVVAVFSEIKNNQLRVDLVPYFLKYPQYFGDVQKFYFRFNKTKIVEAKNQTAHYECW